MYFIEKTFSRFINRGVIFDLVAFAGCNFQYECVFYALNGKGVFTAFNSKGVGD